MFQGEALGLKAMFGGGGSRGGRGQGLARLQQQQRNLHCPHPARVLARDLASVLLS